MVGLGHIAIKALLVCGQNGGTVVHPLAFLSTIRSLGQKELIQMTQKAAEGGEEGI